MKKLLSKSLLFFLILSSFSYSLNLDEAVDYYDPTNIYDKTEKYIDSNFSEADTEAYQKVASLYWTNQNVIISILEWDLTKCLEIFWVMGINPPYKKYDFLTCQATIQAKVESYKKTKIFNLSVEDSTAWENILSDGIEDNWPFDLLVDINTMSKVLFKDEIKFDNVSYQVAIDNSKNKLRWKNLSWWFAITKWESEEDKIKELDKLIEEIKKDNEKYNAIADAEENNNPTEENNNDNNWIIEENNNYLEEEENKQQNYTNKNLQIWNICANNFQNQNNQNKPEEKISTEENNEETTNNFSYTNNNPLLATDDDIYGFNTFTGWWDLWGFINWDGEIGIWWSDSPNLAEEIWQLEKNQWVCPPQDYILAVCVKLIPTWPRWPVWWTVYKRWIDSIIKKINDTLREMKDQNFISQAWHWDEALEIDYKNIDLSEHFSFDIVISPKPVFDFKRDEKIEKEKNLPDTNWKWVPRKLAIMYYNYGIGDPLDKENDKNKYLISNLDYVDPLQNIKNNYEELVNDSSEKWMYSILERHNNYITELNKSMKLLIDVAKKIKSTLEFMNAKSQ